MQNAKEKIIVAVDVDNLEDARAMVKTLNPHVGAFKIGLQLMNNEGAPQIVHELQVDGGKIFFDGKFKDIPNTVAGAVRAVTRLGVWMFNVHALGGREMMVAAREAAEATAQSSNVAKPIILAVTILTSFDIKGLQEIGFPLNNEKDLKDLVVRLAKLTQDAGLDGVVASPQEVALIKEACGSDFKVVTPGVRPVWAASGDQKRITTPADAVGLGSDYLVIGRPITKPPEQIGSWVDAAKKIVEEIEKV